MIRYALRCEPGGHGFDGWFRSSEDYDRQSSLRLVACPLCGATDVEKELMRPAVTGAGREAAAMDAATAFARLQSMAREVRANGDYVGPKFAEEARRIHYGEAQSRQIFGEASATEVKGLAEEGIPALPLPPLPEDKN